MLPANDSIHLSPSFFMRANDKKTEVPGGRGRRLLIFKKQMKKANLAGAIYLIIGLAAGNFIWQMIQIEPIWKEAFKISFYQTAAVLCAWKIWS